MHLTNLSNINIIQLDPSFEQVLKLLLFLLVVLNASFIGFSLPCLPPMISKPCWNYSFHNWKDRDTFICVTFSARLSAHRLLLITAAISLTNLWTDNVTNNKNIKNGGWNSDLCYFTSRNWSSLAAASAMAM